MVATFHVHEDDRVCVEIVGIGAQAFIAIRFGSSTVYLHGFGDRSAVEARQLADQLLRAADEMPKALALTDQAPTEAGGRL